MPGNHDVKLLQKLRGKDVKIAHGLADSIAQLEVEPPEFKSKVADFLDGLISHYVLDDGKLVVAHAGMKEEMQGRGSAAIRSFALFGETTGETDEFGLPVRYNWAADYRGKAMVVYGHTPVGEPQWLNRTINIDTGCVFGGKLTALRYPEKELVSVPAARTYCEPARPFLAKPPGDGLTAQQQHDDLLDLDEVLGKRQITTRLLGNVTIREENAARRRFGVVGQGIGICTTRTGRRFFDDAGLEAQLLERVRSAAEAAGLWPALQTDWLCLDCELMPWSAKAQELLRQQYAAV